MREMSHWVVGLDVWCWVSGPCRHVKRKGKGSGKPGSASRVRKKREGGEEGKKREGKGSRRERKIRKREKRGKVEKRS